MNPDADSILTTINLTKGDVERFRDCYLEGDKICVYTRTGGGNRDDYPNEKLTSHPNYLYDEDDDFDSTYASYYFKFPEQVERRSSAHIQNVG
jgi:hypothetical protein